MARVRLSRPRRAVRRPVHPGHDHAPDLPATRPGNWLEPGEVARDEAGALGRRRRPAAGDRRPRREDEQVQAQHGRSRPRSSRPTAPTPRACSCCPTARPSATWNGPTPASTAPGATSTGSGAWSTSARPRLAGARPAGELAPEAQGAQAAGAPDDRPGHRRARAAPLQQGRGAGARAVERGRAVRAGERRRPALLREALETVVLLLGPDGAAPGRGAVAAARARAAAGRDAPGRRRTRPGSSPTRSIVAGPGQRQAARRARAAARQQPRPRSRPLALADAAVQRAMEGKPPRRVVVVPDKIVNVVV